MYPMDLDEIVELAGIQAAIEETSSGNSPSVLYYKDRLVHYFPYYMVKRTRGIIFPKLKPPYVPSLEERLRDEHQKVLPRNPANLKLEYLEKCRAKSFYGSVLFSWQIQRKLLGYVHHKLFGSIDRLVSVAINTNGLHIIRKTTPPELLLSLPFCEVSWLYKECKDTGDEYFSALVLEFDLDENSGETVPKQLKIFSRQAPMMDNMIKRITDDLNCCEHKKRQQRISGSDIDEVDFLEQPFQRIIVDHMLVCEDPTPDGTCIPVSKPVKSKTHGRKPKGKDDIEMGKLSSPSTNTQVQSETAESNRPNSS